MSTYFNRGTATTTIAMTTVYAHRTFAFKTDTLVVKAAASRVIENCSSGGCTTLTFMTHDCMEIDNRSLLLEKNIFYFHLFSHSFISARWLIRLNSVASIDRLTAQRITSIDKR